MKKDPRRWDVMIRLIQENGFNHFVEIGVKEGRTTHRVLKDTKCFVSACDPWVQRPDKADTVPVGGETYLNCNFSNIKREFWQNVGAWKDRLDFYRERSDQFVNRLLDESVDLVFIDAEHDYEAIKKDIEMFWPKVRKGGILSGHDYQDKFPGVIQAVSERFDDVNLEVDSVWWVRK